MPQILEERGIVDPAGLVMAKAVIDDKARGKLSGLAAGMTSPDAHHPAKIDIQHDAAEIEQQGVGGAGGDGGRGHVGGGVRKSQPPCNDPHLPRYAMRLSFVSKCGRDMTARDT